MATNLQRLGLLQVTIVHALFRMWLLTSDIFDRWCSDTVTEWRSKPKIFFGAKNFAGRGNVWF